MSASEGSPFRRKDRGMMKRIQKILWIVAVLQLLFAVGCQKKAVLYDSEGSAGEDWETEAEGTKAEGTEEPKETDATREDAVICVYVCGEVASPGVYELPAEARIEEAVEAAGGMTEEAASAWLNLAEHMTDGQKIEVPSKERAEELSEESTQEEKGLINLNTASKEQLMTLRGIGESKAEDIVNYREQQGGFRTLEELMQIPGIKEGVFEKIKDQITV